MTWAKCHFCDHKKNGYRRLQHHEETVHPLEYKRLEAQAELDNYLANAVADLHYIADYEDYQAALLLDLPPAARKVIEERLERWPYHQYRDGTMGIDNLRRAVEHWHPQQIALLQKALAELEAKS